MPNKKISEIKKVLFEDLDLISRENFIDKRQNISSLNHFYADIRNDCYEYLNEMGIVYDTQKRIPLTSVICDIYLEDCNIWIGVERKKKLGKFNYYKYWGAKIEKYRRQNLNFYIVESLADFKQLIETLIKTHAN